MLCTVGSQSVISWGGEGRRVEGGRKSRGRKKRNRLWEAAGRPWCASGPSPRPLRVTAAGLSPWEVPWCGVRRPTQAHLRVDTGCVVRGYNPGSTLASHGERYQVPTRSPHLTNCIWFSGVGGRPGNSNFENLDPPTLCDSWTFLLSFLLTDHKMVLSFWESSDVQQTIHFPY